MASKKLLCLARPAHGGCEGLLEREGGTETGGRVGVRGGARVCTVVMRVVRGTKGVYLCRSQSAMAVTVFYICSGHNIQLSDYKHPLTWLHSTDDHKSGHTLLLQLPDGLWLENKVNYLH